jgi:hypothetical protein
MEGPKNTSNIKAFVTISSALIEFAFSWVKESERKVFAGASSIIHSRIICCGDGGGDNARTISPRMKSRFLNLGRLIV